MKKINKIYKPLARLIKKKEKRLKLDEIKFQERHILAKLTQEETRIYLQVKRISNQKTFQGLMATLMNSTKHLNSN